MSALEKLIKEMVDEALNEVSYTEKDIPRVFWMVTDVSEHSTEFLEQLAKGELKGVKGISDRKEIVTQWLGIARNAVLVIQSKPFLELNKVSRVMYDNPHYLVSNGMASLFRLFNRTKERDYDWSGTMQTVMDYVRAIGKRSKHANKDMATVLYNIDYGTLAPSWYGSAYRDEKPSINTLKDLATWIRKATIDIANKNEKYIVENAEALTIQDWMPLIVEALETVGKVYQDEGEWLVKGDTMKVPNGSTLIVALDVDPRKISDQAREEYAKGEVDAWDPPKLKTEKDALARMDLVKSYNLDKRYNVNFIDMKKFEKYREKYHAKRSAQ